MRTLSLALILVVICSSTAFARDVVLYVVTDNHPTGGPGKTNHQFTFQKGDPRFQVKGPGKCGDLYLGGFAFGHPSPHRDDPSAVCGHGYVLHLTFARTGPSPVSILPIQAPMPLEENATTAADAAKVIRELLPRLDKSDGDRLPEVVHLRDVIRTIDVLNGVKAIPKRQVRN